MSELKRVYNMNPRRFSEIYEEVMKELNPIKQDEIRKEKACIIEDIFRSAKLAQIYDPRFKEELSDWWGFFSKLYELDLDTLDSYSKALDKRNTNYMRAQVTLHNLGMI